MRAWRFPANTVGELATTGTAQSSISLPPRCSIACVPAWQILLAASPRPARHTDRPCTARPYPQKRCSAMQLRPMRRSPSPHARKSRNAPGRIRIFPNACPGGLGGSAGRPWQRTNAGTTSASGRSAAGSRISSHGTSASSTPVSISMRVSWRFRRTPSTRRFRPAPAGTARAPLRPCVARYVGRTSGMSPPGRSGNPPDTSGNPPPPGEKV
jgi:hypothetical protein